MKKRVKIKMADIFIIFFALILTAFLAIYAYFTPHGVSRVLIRGQSMEWSFPLNAEETVVVSGPLGNTIVRLENNRAWVETSPCENQTCVASGAIHSQGQWAACLPNNVLVMIHGVKDEDVDAITR